MKTTPEKRKRVTGAVLCILLALLSAASFSCSRRGAGLPSPSDAFYIYDETGTVSEQTKENIISRASELYDKTGAQIVVAVVGTTGDADIADYACDLFNAWEIGDKDKENGLLLLISKDEDDYWAVQGRGIEDILTSGELKLMLDAYLEPDFARGDIDSGVRRFFDSAVRFFESAYSVSVGEGESAVQEGGSGRATWILRAVRRAAGFCIVSFFIIAGGAVLLLVLGRKKAAPTASRTNVPKGGETHLGGQSGYNYDAARRTSGVNTSYKTPETSSYTPRTDDFDWSGFISTLARGAYIAKTIGRYTRGTGAGSFTSRPSVHGTGSRPSASRPSGSGFSGGSFRPTSPRSGMNGSSFGSGLSFGGRSSGPSFGGKSSGSSFGGSRGGGGGTRGGGAGRR